MEELAAREMTGTQILLSRISVFWARFRRRYIPFLVWHGQEVNVCVTWKENRLCSATPEQALAQLTSGHIYKMEQMASEIGITFDTGMGCGGRDWFWDFSLRGPISLKFRSPCKTVERRQ